VKFAKLMADRMLGAAFGLSRMGDRRCGMLSLTAFDVQTES